MVSDHLYSYFYSPTIIFLWIRSQFRNGVLVGYVIVVKRRRRKVVAKRNVLDVRTGNECNELAIGDILSDGNLVLSKVIIIKVKFMIKVHR